MSPPVSPDLGGGAHAAWYAAVTQLLAGARTGQRRIPAETVDALLAARPEPRLLDRVRAAGCEPSLTADQLEAAGFLDALQVTPTVPLDRPTEARLE